MVVMQKLWTQALTPESQMVKFSLPNINWFPNAKQKKLELYAVSRKHISTHTTKIQIQLPPANRNGRMHTRVNHVLHPRDRTWLDPGAGWRSGTGDVTVADRGWGGLGADAAPGFGRHGWGFGSCGWGWFHTPSDDASSNVLDLWRRRRFLVLFFFNIWKENLYHSDPMSRRQTGLNLKPHQCSNPHTCLDWFT